MPESKEAKPHILFLCKWFPYNHDPQLGIFAYKHAVAASRFYTVSAVHVRSDEELSLTYFFDVRQTEVLTVNAYFKKSKFSFVNFIRYIRAGLKAYKMIVRRCGKPSLLNFYILNRPALFGILISTIDKIPFVITEQWSGYITGDFRNKNILKRLMTSFLIKKSKAVIVVSEALKKAMIGSGLRGRYFVVPNVVEGISAPVQNKGSNKLSLLMVTDLVDEIKNISGVLKALQLLKKEKENFTLELIGGGPDEAKIKEAAISYGLKDDIEFYGKQPNGFVYKKMKEADMVIVNSNVETFSVICAEAMVNGKPVIATRCGGPEEIVTGETGLLIEKNNPQALKEAILAVKENLHEYDPGRMNRLALEKYSYEAAGKKLFEAFVFALGHKSQQSE